MSAMTDHARAELERVGEEPRVVDGVVRVVAAFFDTFDSGASADAALPMLERLLRRQALTDLTDDPDEWEDRTECSGQPFWQSKRDSTAFSHDGGVTYWLLAEADAAGSLAATPLHRSVETGKRGTP